MLFRSAFLIGEVKRKISKLVLIENHRRNHLAGENYSLLIVGVSNGDEDGGGADGDDSGGNYPSRQGAGTGTSDPQNLSSMAAALRNFSWISDLV